MRIVDVEWHLHSKPHCELWSRHSLILPVCVTDVSLGLDKILAIPLTIALGVLRSLGYIGSACGLWMLRGTCMATLVVSCGHGIAWCYCHSGCKCNDCACLDGVLVVLHYNWCSCALRSTHCPPAGLSITARGRMLLACAMCLQGAGVYRAATETDVTQPSFAIAVTQPVRCMRRLAFAACLQLQVALKDSNRNKMWQSRLQ